MNKNNVLIVGQGYVGLPLAISAAKSGYVVIGYDTSNYLIGNLKIGISSSPDILSQDLTRMIESKAYTPTSDISNVFSMDIIVICVPTPLDELKSPDLTYIKQSLISVAHLIKPGILVILESTVATGFTRGKFMSWIHELTGLDPTEISIAFSPERIDPGNHFWKIENTPKLVAGLDDGSRSKAVTFYTAFKENLVECDSVEVAESAKLLENSFRLINISFINEFSIFCAALKVDVRQVIAASSTKPYGFMSFYPSLGVGGHCIPVDPVYLADKARGVQAPILSIEVALEINRQLPKYFIDRVDNKLENLVGKKIIVIGVAYKSNSTDVRETPVLSLIQGLRERGADVVWHDDLVKNWNGEKSTELNSDFDLAILATLHDNLNLETLGKVPLLDTHGSLS